MSNLSNQSATHCAGLPAGTDEIEALRHAVRWLWKMIQIRRRELRDRRHLMSLPDEMLRDVGIGRSEINRLVRHGRDFRTRG